MNRFIMGFRNFANKIFANMTFANTTPGVSPISLWIKCELKKFLSATLMSVSYDIPIPIRLTWALTYILYWYCLVTTGKVHLTFANTSADFRHWRMSYWWTSRHPSLLVVYRYFQWKRATAYLIWQTDKLRDTFKNLFRKFLFYNF